MGVQRRHVPHFKGLIYAKVDLEAQGRDSTFTFCHALLIKTALVSFVLSTTVCCEGSRELCVLTIKWDRSNSSLGVGVQW